MLKFHTGCTKCEWTAGVLDEDAAREAIKAHKHKKGAFMQPDEASFLDAAVTMMFNRSMQWFKCPKCGAQFAALDEMHCGVKGVPTTIEVRVI